MNSDRNDEFRRVLETAEAQIDLGRAALAIAQSAYPDLNIEGCLFQLESLGQAVNDRVGNEKNPYRMLAAINTVLFKDMGFEGNRADYYDPRNSFLNEVLDRRKGIPISLAVLYIEVARRIGLAVHGVGFPGHFLVKYQEADENIVIDVFNKGEILAESDMARLLAQLYGARLTFQAGFLAATSKREILRRMLNNLKLIYLQADAPLQALQVVEQLLILDPSCAPEIRDRGLLWAKVEGYARAVEDLEKYLSLVPAAADAALIKAQIAAIKERAILIH